MFELPKQEEYPEVAQPEASFLICQMKAITGFCLPQSPTEVHRSLVNYKVLHLWE